MRIELASPELAVDRRLGRDVDAHVGEPRHDLVRREIDVLRRCRDLDDLAPFVVGQLVGGRCVGAVSSVVAAVRTLQKPALHGADAELEHLATRPEASTTRARLGDELGDHSSLNDVQAH
ncbi:MAG: hypothetical protein KBB21_38220 [Nannocystaceae bacterium]|nr:hypothetical protein [Nannocystaceae bacterium]